MTTYNTYQEAKIANPECEIVVLDKPSSELHGKFEAQVFDGGVGVHVMKPDGGWEKCNPADYCMTVERFLADGCGFFDGDAYLDWKGAVRIVGKEGFVSFACNDIKNIAYGDQAFILRAAALEEDKPLLQTGEEYEHTKALNFIYDRLTIVHGENQNFDYMHKLKNAIKMVESFESPCNQSIAQEKPRTKSDWVKVSDSIFNLEGMFKCGELYISHCDGHYQQILNESSLYLACAQGLLFRRVETQMTEREVFIESATGILKSGMSDVDYAGALFDSGKFKLVN